MRVGGKQHNSEGKKEGAGLIMYGSVSEKPKKLFQGANKRMRSSVPAPPRWSARPPAWITEAISRRWRGRISEGRGEKSDRDKERKGREGGREGQALVCGTGARRSWRRSQRTDYLIWGDFGPRRSNPKSSKKVGRR